MNYRINPKNNDSLSILGFGCMRFAKDKGEVERQIIHAIEAGVNYFDTAYTYRNSESTLGSVLSKGYRDRVKIATKIPPGLIKKYEDFDRIFNTQLIRLQTDHVDYYLLHMLTDVSILSRLAGLGLFDWINEKKQKKQIINMGFSYHGGKAEFIRIIDAHDWDFCMIQYNYLDENNQAGKSGLEYAHSKGLPVMVMEPLRGGKLATGLPKEVANIWNKAPVKRSPAEWGLRWVWNHPEVTLLLSGMNSMEMVDENVRIASETKANSLSENDFVLFNKVRDIMMEKVKIPCTGCNYCMPCPNGVDIPTCFACYNDREIEGKTAAIFRYIILTSLKAKPQNASICSHCGKCETHCPQNIKIREELEEVSKKLERLFYKPLRFLMRKVNKLK